MIEEVNFILRVEAGFQPICLSIVKMFRFLWTVKYKKIYAPDNNSYEGDVSADEIMVQYTYETINTPSTTVVVTYTVDITGKIQVNVHYNGVKGLPEFPVFGMRFVMPTLQINIYIKDYQEKLIQIEKQEQ